ncbi:RNA polymerase sigma-70 factor (ECF subfamily) [Mobilisporobacter senegalensis]|uniref:RNA polymerase sigma-70 factor (ECF subfamily) n=1 Tax=Mobilisporobacter senegalensis TaxID=1329262 RepID=A0A3N1XUB5_9FIRM|nr:sigma-70 family RNA polymerase sigma factor [Mobilisporobacter senegalensis]ROR28477.1 RNA polymerase sigma-70 factor (ECF subfamily) [Mobilisporobacter senegalensis]
MQYSFGTDEYIHYILDNYSTMLIKLAFTYVKNISDAEDIVQDIFVSLMKRGKGFDNEEHERAWLIRVTINKCKNHLKSSWNRLKVPLEENISYQQEEQSEVLSVVLDLPDKYRTVIHLYYYENYSINEIAELMTRRPATIGTWLSRGRNLLKSKLEGGFEYE